MTGISGAARIDAARVSSAAELNGGVAIRAYGPWGSLDPTKAPLHPRFRHKYQTSSTEAVLRKSRYLVGRYPYAGAVQHNVVIVTNSSSVHCDLLKKKIAA